jgi:hypothetical protein
MLIGLGICGLILSICYLYDFRIELKENEFDIYSRSPFRKFRETISYNSVIDLERPYKYSLKIRSNKDMYPVYGSIALVRPHTSEFKEIYELLKMSLSNKPICFIRIFLAMKMNRPDLVDQFDGEHEVYQLLLSRISE